VFVQSRQGVSQRNLVWRLLAELCPALTAAPCPPSRWCKGAQGPRTRWQPAGITHKQQQEVARLEHELKQRPKAGAHGSHRLQQIHCSIHVSPLTPCCLFCRHVYTARRDYCSGRQVATRHAQQCCEKCDGKVYAVLAGLVLGRVSVPPAYNTGNDSGPVETSVPPASRVTVIYYEN
jgi:hypothetical protein